MSHMIAELPRLADGNIDWAQVGIEWAEGETVRVGGRDGKLHTDVQIPVCTNLEKLLQFVSPAAVLASLDGTSWRVSAQDVNRKKFTDAVENKRESEVFTADGKLTAFGLGLRKAVWDRLMGLRGERKQSAPVVKIVEKITLLALLPNGQKVAVTNAEEFGAEYLAVAVDMGIPAAVARAMMEAQVATLFPNENK